jgi:hypothetical protein
MLLTTAQFVKKYSGLGLTTKQIDELIKQGQITAVRTLNRRKNKYQIDSTEVYQKYAKVNEDNSGGITKINEIFHGKEFVKAVQK